VPRYSGVRIARGGAVLDTEQVPVFEGRWPALGVDPAGGLRLVGFSNDGEVVSQHLGDDGTISPPVPWATAGGRAMLALTPNASGYLLVRSGPVDEHPLAKLTTSSAQQLAPDGMPLGASWDLLGGNEPVAATGAGTIAVATATFVDRSDRTLSSIVAGVADPARPAVTVDESEETKRQEEYCSSCSAGGGAGLGLLVPVVLAARRRRRRPGLAGVR